MNKKHLPKSRLIMYIILVFFAGIQLFPLVWLVDFSLLNNSDLFGPRILVWPEHPRFENYVKAWVHGDIPRLFLNSIIVNAATIVLTVLLVTMLSYAFTRMQWKLKKVFFRAVLIGLMIPIHVTLLPNFFTFSALGLRNSYFGLIIPYVAFSLPIGVFLMSSFIESMSRSVEESAIIDGCGVWRIIFNIVMPLNKPALVAIVVTTFLNSWNEFIMAVTYLNDNRFRTLPFSVYNFAGRYSSDYAVQFAVMTITALPTIVLFIVFNEQMTKGIMLGSVKS
ncbi:sugar ABC transporter permease [Spirochaetia bacterium]|nr:sugar ABC transporter permease [Spirochaetia bacterium]